MELTQVSTITAHTEAVEQCNLLHRDVSAGNILILPMIFVTSNKTKGQRISVMWCGVLSDWELATKLPDANETSKSLQRSHRAVVRVSILLHVNMLCNRY